MTLARRRSLTGIKPTGAPHIGNFLGAIRPALQLAEGHDAFYFIADLHAMTTTPDREKLKQETHEVAATWLALGLDTDKACFYRQSDIPEVTQLAWVLSCATPMGLLSRAHTFKEQTKNQGLAPEEVRHGLFSYPVLMAADILLFDADVVPVGKDQKQHLEICQEAARKVNLIYGEGTLKIPEAQIDERVMTVPGLDGRKMSKSYDNTIPVFMPDKPLKKRVGKIVTDSTDFGLPLKAEGDTVFSLFELFADKNAQAKLTAQYATGRKDPEGPDVEDNYFGWGHAKASLFEQIRDTFSDARAEYDRLLADPAHIDAVLAKGAAKARVVSGEVMDRVRVATGLG